MIKINPLQVIKISYLNEFGDFTINVLLFLMTILNFVLLLYVEKRKLDDILIIPILLFNYFLSVTLTNILYLFGYIGFLKGTIFYMIFQGNLIWLVMAILMRNKKFRKWYDNLSFKKILGVFKK